MKAALAKANSIGLQWNGVITLGLAILALWGFMKRKGGA